MDYQRSTFKPCKRAAWAACRKKNDESSLCHLLGLIDASRVNHVWNQQEQTAVGLPLWGKNPTRPFLVMLEVKTRQLLEVCAEDSNNKKGLNTLEFMWRNTNWITKQLLVKTNWQSFHSRKNWTFVTTSKRWKVKSCWLLLAIS